MKLKTARYSKGMARMRFKGDRHRLWILKGKINGYSVYAEKHCVMIKIPKGSPKACGLPEGDWLGFENLILTEAEYVNPALFGRE